jgi:isopentenyl-diphosphate Delta-isomerase
VLPGREASLVELVSEDGVPTGSATVADAHAGAGLLHRAFSVLLFDPDGRTLLQRRARVKTRFPLRWGNACCGHPYPGQDVAVAAARRLSEELGLDAVDLIPAGRYVYRASDVATGRVEHEYDHVLAGRIAADEPLRPDPTEVDEVRWVTVEELRRDLDADPERYAPWLAGVLAAWAAQSDGR